MVTEATTTTRLTYEEYLKEPVTMHRYDIVDGEVVMLFRHTTPPQIDPEDAFGFLHQFVTERNLGEVYFSPEEVLAQHYSILVGRPDLLYVSNQVAFISREQTSGSPTLVVELLSPDRNRANIESSLAEYARIGVRECWLVSPQGCTVETLQLDSGEWKRLAIRGVGENVETVVLAGLELPVSDIFRGA